MFTNHRIAVKFDINVKISINSKYYKYNINIYYKPEI